MLEAVNRENCSFKKNWHDLSRSKSKLLKLQIIEVKFILIAT